MSKNRREAGFRCTGIAALALTALATAIPALTFAQEAAPNSPTRLIEVKAVAGFSTFIDNDFIEHVVTGGSVRLGLVGRWSIEPQVLYMRAGAHDQDFYVLNNLVYDLGTRGRVTPYLIAGAGVFWHRERLGRYRELVFTSRSWHFSGGAGARIRLGERWSLASEARFGIQPFFQVHAGLGYSF